MLLQDIMILKYVSLNMQLCKTVFRFHSQTFPKLPDFRMSFLSQGKGWPRTGPALRGGGHGTQLVGKY